MIVSDVDPKQGKAAAQPQLACNLCGSLEQEIVFGVGEAQRNQIVRCVHCGLMYASPRLAPVDVEQIRDYDPEFVFDALQTSDPWRVEKESLQVADYRSTRRLLAERNPQRGRLLEVGSGLGFLLNYFREDGWRTVGVEPNAGLCLHAQRKLGLDVFAGTLDESELEPASFDAAIMMHVIEHVPDPLELLHDVRRLLRPGGMLVVETPRYDTLAFRLLGRRERSLSCEGHIYFFTTQTLTAMAEKAGFRVVRHDAVGRSMTLERLLYNVGVMSRSPATQHSLKRLSSRFRLNRAHVTLNARDMQRFYLENPASTAN